VIQFLAYQRGNFVCPQHPWKYARDDCRNQAFTLITDWL
jgi:hypothetical protein